MTSVLSLGVGDAQRDPQVGVGPDLRGHDAARPLGGQDQVDAERAAALGDVDQAGDEVGQLADHRGELVDDDDQPGHRRQGRVSPRAGRRSRRCPWRPPPPAGARGDAARRPATPAPARPGGVSRSVTMPTVCGSRSQSCEGGAALVVDEHEGQGVRAVRDRERGDQRLQQLGLAGTGRARDQAVRPVAAQVDAERAVHRLTEQRLRCCDRPAPSEPRWRRASAARGRARRAAGSTTAGPSPRRRR